jgi:hypothetical protein
VVGTDTNIDLVISPKGTGSMRPVSNNTYSNGTSSFYWSNLYATTLNLNSTASISGGTAGVATLTGSLSFSAGSGDLTLSENSGRFFIKSTAGTGINSLVHINNATATASSVGTGVLLSTGTAPDFVGGFGAAWSGGTTNSLFALRVVANGTLTNLDTTAPLYVIGNSGGGTEVHMVGTTYLAATTNIADAKNIVLGITTGTKIGTATSQKLSFWNNTPITQPTTGIAAATFAANTSGTLNDSATWGGYTVGQVVQALQNVGLLQ